MKTKVLLGIFVTLAVLAIGISASSTRLKTNLAVKNKKIGSVKRDKSIDVATRGKEVRKRGILHNGLGAASLTAQAYWPKPFSTSYGYAAVASAPALVKPRVPTLLKYPGEGLHTYNAHAFALAPSSALQAVSAFPQAQAQPHLQALPPAQVLPQAPAATPFVLRPGGAFVQSYSVSYPRHYQKPAVAVEAAQPVAHSHLLQPLSDVQPAASIYPVQHLTPAQHLTPVHHDHHEQVLQPVHPIQPLGPVHPRQTAIPLNHVQSFVNFQAVPAIETVQHGAHVHPVAHVDSAQAAQPVQPFHHYLQTALIRPDNAAVAPHFPVIPQIPAAPALPALPAIPAFPAAPTAPAAPALPPDFPVVSSPGPIFTVPTLPDVHTDAFPSEPIFPIGVLPPRPQPPPPFISFPLQPSSFETQLPGVLPLPPPSQPDSGSAVASPQIPSPALLPEPLPELEHPAQEPWRPIFHHPPATSATPGSLIRPSHTLLPPYDSHPAEGYLPPTPHHQRLQEQKPQHLLHHQLHQTDNIFEHLSDQEIEHIFAQASQAMQAERLHQQQTEQQQQQQQQQQRLVIHTHHNGYEY